MVTRDEEIAWAAGLFEGEGTFTWDYGRAQLRVKMTDLDVLEKLLDIWSVGKVYGPYETNSKDGSVRKPTGSGSVRRPSCQEFSLLWPLG
jgi:hypothetical protein